MVKNLRKVFSIYRKHTKLHQAWAIGTISSYSIATFIQNVLAPMFAASLFALMAKHDNAIFNTFWYLVIAIIIPSLGVKTLAFRRSF